jgi:hypothetical protein
MVCTGSFLRLLTDEGKEDYLRIVEHSEGTTAQWGKVSTGNLKIFLQVSFFFSIIY